MSRLKSNIEYIGEWEALYNPNFNYTVFGTIKDIIAKTGRYLDSDLHNIISIRKTSNR